MVLGAETIELVELFKPARICAEKEIDSSTRTEGLSRKKNVGPGNIDFFVPVKSCVMLTVVSIGTLTNG